MMWILPVIDWTVAALFALVGLFSLSHQLLSGLACLLAAALLAPATSSLIRARLPILQSTGVRLGAIAACILLGGALTKVHELDTEIIIDAPPDRIWPAIVDFPRHAEWNPFIKQIEGEPLLGTTLTITVAGPDEDPMTFTPTVLVVDPSKELRWRGRLLLPRIFDGEHVFRLEPVDDNRTRFHHFERFRGLLVPLFWSGLDTNTRAGFNLMNTALKTLSETETQ